MRSGGTDSTGALPPAADGAGQIVHAALESQVRALRAAEVLLRAGQPDAVHRLRVACRRLRSIMAAFREVLDPEATAPLRAELRWLGRELGGVRDEEVALRHLAELVDALPADLVRGPVAARVSEARMRQERAGADRALATLGDRRYAALLVDLSGMLADPPLLERAQRPARPVLLRALRGTRTRLVRRVDAAEAAEAAGDGDPLHEVCKAVKRVRYTAEVAGPRLGRRAAGLVPAMQQLQDVLGQRQDSIVTRACCRRLGIAAASEGETAWTYRRLYALEEEREARTERAFWVRWYEMEGPRTSGRSGPDLRRG